MLMVRFPCILALILLFTAGPCTAQIEEDNVIISARRSGTIFKATPVTSEYGIDVQYFVEDRWSFNYEVAIGEDFIHIPASVPLMLFGLTLDWAYLLLPEGVSYHIPVMEDMVVISPYLNPLGFEYNKYAENDGWYGTGAGGVRMNIFPHRRVMLHTFAEYKINYEQPNSGFRTGLGLGISLF